MLVLISRKKCLTCCFGNGSENKCVFLVPKELIFWNQFEDDAEICAFPEAIMGNYILSFVIVCWTFMLRVIVDAAESSASNFHFSQEYAFRFDQRSKLNWATTQYTLRTRGRVTVYEESFPGKRQQLWRPAISMLHSLITSMSLWCLPKRPKYVRTKRKGQEWKSYLFRLGQEW